MTNYAARYRQAVSEKNYAFARTVITSATAAARSGLITPEQVAEVEANPPDGDG